MDASLAPPTVVVLGMHRSGTSFLMGSLQRAGLHLGTVSNWNEHNRRGNREQSDVVALNDAVLAANGAAWDHPPTRPVRWSADHLQEARQIIRENSDPTGWGFKDPRTLLTLRGWQQELSKPTFVGTFRHPMAVVESLQKRAAYGGIDMTLGHCLSLWHTYNACLLAQYRAAPFPIVSFDAPAPELQRQVNHVAHQLGLQPGPSTFLDPGLRTAPAASNELPADVATVYRSLQAHSVLAQA